MGRSPCCEKVGLKKGPWTPEEDQKLLAYIEKHGHGSWRALPIKAGEFMLSYIDIYIYIYNCSYFCLLMCRTSKVWQELQTQMDQLSQTRYQERQI